MLKARNTRTITLPSLVDDAGRPVPITIKKVGLEQIGVSEGLKLARSRLLIQEAAERHKLGQETLQSTAEAGHLPYSGTPNRHAINDLWQDREFNAELLLKAQVRLCEAACVSPTWLELCAAYDAPPDAPWEGMGHEYKLLCEAISAFGGGVAVPDAAAAERFPEG